MKRALMLWTAVSLTGCVFYQDSGNKFDRDDDTEDRWSRDDSDDWPDFPDPDTAAVETDDTDHEQDEGPPPVVPLVFDPAVAYPGDLEILLITSTGNPDLSAVTDVRFYGEAGVSVLALRGDGPTRLYVALAVPEDAKPGWQDVFVEFGGSAELYRDAFQVMPSP